MTDNRVSIGLVLLVRLRLRYDVVTNTPNMRFRMREMSRARSRTVADSRKRIAWPPTRSRLGLDRSPVRCAPCQRHLDRRRDSVASACPRPGLPAYPEDMRAHASKSVGVWKCSMAEDHRAVAAAGGLALLQVRQEQSREQSATPQFAGSPSTTRRLVRWIGSDPTRMSLIQVTGYDRCVQDGEDGCGSSESAVHRRPSATRPRDPRWQ